MTFDPKKHMTNLRGKDYLEVKWRIKWFRTDYRTGRIDTEIISFTEPPIVKATILDEDGELLAVGHGSAQSDGNKVWSGREIEKAETAAIGRALAHAGYGTQFSDMDEEDHLADG